MPQVSKSRSDAELIQSDSTPLRQRLMDRFKPSDFVRVKNVDDEPFAWQYMPTDGEESYVTEDNTRQVLGRRSFNGDYSKMSAGNEQLWEIEAGAEEVIQGENAYLFIEGLYKRLVGKKAVAEKPKEKLKEYEARSLNWGDVTLQEYFIDQIFIGVETPQFGVQNVPAQRAPRS